MHVYRVAAVVQMLLLQLHDMVERWFIFCMHEQLNVDVKRIVALSLLELFF